MSESGRTEVTTTGAGSSMPCVCTVSSHSDESLLRPECECPTDEIGLVVHERSCLLYKAERFVHPHDVTTCECESPVFEDGICRCCRCPRDLCLCKRAGKDNLDKWRHEREIFAMPAVLEASHPLMKRFQETLKQFLLRENQLAEEEILNLREEVRLSKLAYNKDLEKIYLNDHDTNTQRMLIEEYEASLAQRAMEREAAEKRAKESNEKYKKVKAKLEQDAIREREAREEMEALNALCNQLEAWRDETDSELTVSHRTSDKIKAEKRALAEEKRRLDMFILSLTNEVWRLESKLELFKNQLQIKNNEMEKINDKVTAYAAELEDLELDKRRLVSLWNSVIVNIKQRDNVYDSVRDDYKALQENYRTLLNNLEITKKAAMEEMSKSKEITMNRDKLLMDIEHASKILDAEDAKKLNMEAQIVSLTESIEMSERDHEMLKLENQSMKNALKSTQKELDRKIEHKLKLENEILSNLQECLLNDKAVESMANGIRKMREMTRKQEISLMSMENQHARIMLDIERQRTRQANNDRMLQETVACVTEKEKELDLLEAEYDQKMSVMTRKQRELDIISKKYTALKEEFDMKSPQERRIENLEKQIKCLRERTEVLQHEWLRQQGHVVKLADHHHKMVTDINLINKQIQICDQKLMRIQAESDKIQLERSKVERSLRELRDRLELLQRTRKDATERNENSHKMNLALTHAYTANLKDAETEIIQLEEEIEALDREKMNLTQVLDRVQREALIWQRKGMLAVDLKRNMQTAKSAAGEIGQMRNEIHRMEVRREQLRRTSEKLAEDLALYVMRRESAMDRTRAVAAVEKTHGITHTSQTAYHHKLRLAKADIVRVTKEIDEAKARVEELQKQQERLDREVSETSTLNSQLEEHVADLIQKTRETNRMKNWLLERVVRSQRLGKELAVAVRRQSVRVRRPGREIVEEHNLARLLNERLKFIVNTLLSEYPYLEDKLETIKNTLNIFTPEGTPRLTEEGICTIIDGECFLVCDQSQDEFKDEQPEGSEDLLNDIPSEETLEEQVSEEMKEEEHYMENIAEKPFCYNY